VSICVHSRFKKFHSWFGFWRRCSGKIWNCLRNICITLYFLEIIGATVVSAFGWASCMILGVPVLPSAPLWFAGYLFVYNFDRLYIDPADLINTPLRTSLRKKLERYRLILIVLSGIVLVIWPIVVGCWWLALVTPLGALGLQFYSRPFPVASLRLKDLPLVKSLIAPVLIACITVVWPVIESGHLYFPKEAIVFLWAFAGLMINGLIFDYRDMKGDRLLGTRTLAVILGEKGTICFLIFCSGVFLGISMWLSWSDQLGLFLPIGVALGCGALLFFARRSLHPALLSFLADLLLVIPALALGLK
jgi:4-hydroxybenzoate polyprenyltransferase